jgi:Spy/CpxP family protein refolding chaperone
MKLTKTIALTALVAGSFFAATALQAQDAPKDKPAGEQAAPGRNRPDFAKELNLTEDQKPKFQEIMKSTQEKRKALRDDTSLSDADKKAKAKALREETNKQMKELLTAEQYAKWEKMAQGNRRPPGTPGAAGGDNAPKKD